MKTLNQISQEKYGKNYNCLPDDGAEQDCVQSIFSNQSQTDKATVSLSAIQILILSSKNNDASGHTRYGTAILDRAQSEHAALVAVAEAAQKLTLKMGSTLERECKLALNQELNNLAAVREGGAK